MAIIKCPECAHEVSDKAPICPYCGVEIAGKISVDEHYSKDCTNHHKHNNIKVILIVALVAATLCGICFGFFYSAQSNREQEAYEYALSSKDIQVLQSYLDQYTNAPEAHRDSIQAHLDVLQQLNQDWTNALVSGSRSALKNYIDQNPDSPFVELAKHKIDSIDWAVVKDANTVETIEQYLEQHPDGDYVDEANDRIKSINANTIQPQDRQLVASVFNGFMQSLSLRDEDALTSAVNPLLTSFLGKSNATRNDVATFMRKIYKSDVAHMQWKSEGEYKIEKREVGDQQFEYRVDFSASQVVVRTDNTTITNNYKISATINPEGRISEFNMKKIME